MRVDRNVATMQPKQTRLIRAPLLGTTDSSTSDDEPEDANTSRFVDPYRTDADQRTAIRQVLDDLNVSDEEGRRIFLLALEYEIGAFQQVVLEHLEPIEETGPADERLSDIAKAAKQLLDLLDAACEETRAHILQGMVNADIFNRIADTRYLASLQCEIDRLACACETGSKSISVNRALSMKQVEGSSICLPMSIPSVSKPNPRTNPMSPSPLSCKPSWSRPDCRFASTRVL